MPYQLEQLEQVLSPENLREALSDEHLQTVFPSQAKQRVSHRDVKDYEEETLRNDEPPVCLDDYGMSVWRGEQAKHRDDGSVDRSVSLVNIGRVLYDGGATRSTIVKALEDRDKTLGWEKYTDRKDSEKQYHQIVNLLEKDDKKNNLRTRNLEEKHNNLFNIGQRVLLGETIRQGIKPPEELVPGILLKGKVHQIFAAPGVGKSWLALWLTVKLINQGKPVLYLDTENGPNIISERLKALGADPEKLDECLHYLPSPNLPITREGTEAYVSLLEEINPVFVVFDSWVNFLSGSGLDENVSSDIAKWAVNFARPARDRGITVLLLDHVPKEATNARGSGRKKEEMDVQWQLKNPKSFDRETIGEIKLIREKDREGWLPKSVRFQVGGTEDGFVFEELDEYAGITKVDDKANEKKILKVLREEFSSQGATTTQWERTCKEKEGISRSKFYRAKKNLIEGRDFFKEGNRLYPQDPQKEKVA